MPVFDRHVWLRDILPLNEQRISDRSDFTIPALNEEHVFRIQVGQRLQPLVDEYMRDATQILRGFKNRLTRSNRLRHGVLGTRLSDRSRPVGYLSSSKPPW